MKKLFVYDSVNRLLQGRTDLEGALFHIEAENSQIIGDKYGYEIGSQIMGEVLNRLKKCRLDNIYYEKNVLRISGDEFLMFFPNILDTDEIYKLANGIIREFDTPIRHGVDGIYINVHMGISLFQKSKSTIEECIDQASIALKSTKADGENYFLLYNPSMLADKTKASILREDFKGTVKEDQFVLHYHPQVDLGSKDIVSFEVLTRWQHPKRGLIYPNDFIHIAEDTHFIIPMGYTVLQTACHQLRSWHESGNFKCNISINISPIQLQYGHVIDSVEGILSKAGLDPSYIELEITEHNLIRHMNQTIDVLDELRSMGFKISLDDFGTGYSSLNYLQKLPVDIIKIDKTFIDNLEDDINRSIVKAIIVMGHDMGLCITAEGVETRVQLEVLKELGCDRVQGFLFCKPRDSHWIKREILDRVGSISG